MKGYKSWNIILRLAEVCHPKICNKTFRDISLQVPHEYRKACQIQWSGPATLCILKLK